MKVFKLNAIQREISNLKTAAQLAGLIETIQKSKLGKDTVLKVTALVGQKALTLIANNPSKSEYAALSSLITDVSLSTAADLEIKYSGNGRALEREHTSSRDFAGFYTDYSAYTAKGISNSG